MTKKEIERKTEGWVKSTKEDLDRILYFVKNNEKGLGYEHAMTALQSIASTCYTLAQSFRDWSNEDRQGKLEESTSRRSFKQYLTSKKGVVKEACRKITESSLTKTKLGRLDVGDTFKVWTSGSTFYSIIGKDGDMVKYKDKATGKEESSPKTMEVYLVTESKKIVEDDSWTTADGSKIEVKQDKVFKTTKDGKKFWMPRYTWEHAFDDDGDIENGPSCREPTWFPVK